MEREYIAFISYRHLPLDMRVADKVHEMIERYTIPRELRENGEKHLGIAFRDQEELPLTSDLTGDIYRALDNARFLVVICTPDTPKSLWVTREIEYFISKHGRDRVLTVLADGTMEQSVPKAITTVYADDGVTVIDEREPLAAMIAAETEKKRFHLLKKEFLRLAAAMLGCPYDALVQRNKKYRQQLLSAAFGTVALVALAFIGMLLGKNAEIQAQLYQAQINESVALAYQSQGVLQDGARREALELALQALSSEENDRPYVAQAERALVNALQLYRRPNLRVDRQVQIPDGIWGIEGTSDGKYVFVESAEKRLYCIDTTSGETIWTKEIVCEYPDAIVWMKTVHGDSELLVRTQNDVFTVDVESGEVLRYASFTENGLQGDLLLSEQLMVMDGYLDSDKNSVSACAEAGTALEGSLLIKDDIWQIDDERCSVFVMDEALTHFAFYELNEYSGNVLATADVSAYCMQYLRGEADDVWYVTLDNGNILLILSDMEQKQLEFVELTNHGDVIRQEIVKMKGFFNEITDMKIAGEYMALVTTKYLMIVNLTDFTVKEIGTNNKEYECGLDDEGNVLILFENDSAWYVPSDSQDYKFSLQYMIDAEDGVFEGYRRCWAGSCVYYEAKQGTATINLTQVMGGEWAENYDLFVPDVPENEQIELANDAGEMEIFELCLKQDGTAYAVGDSGIYEYDADGQMLGEKLKWSVPAEQNRSAMLVCDDEVLLTVGHFTCYAYEIDSGELLGSFTLDESSGLAVIQQDAERGYLYVYDSDGDGTGLRVDMKTWQVVAEIQNMRRYLPETNEVVYYTFVGSVEMISPVFSTEELIAMGNEVLYGTSDR